MLPSTETQSCKSCGSPLGGNFCSQCGEKKVNPQKDFAIKKFTEQVVDGFTHFDTKITRTFKALFTWPGLLTWNYLQGIRVNYMKPIQLFIVASLIFYLFMPRSVSFYASFDELKSGFDQPGFSIENPFKFDINKVLVQKAKKELPAGAGKQEIIDKANAIYLLLINKAAALSKNLILLLPFWALCLWALFYKRQSFFVPHLIFALHTFSFFLLLDLLFLLVYFEVIGLRTVHNGTHMLPFFLLLFVYILFSVKKVYGQSWLQNLWKSVVAYVLLLLMILLYRVLITMYVFSS